MGKYLLCVSNIYATTMPTRDVFRILLQIYDGSFACSKLAIETLELVVKYVQS